MKRKKTMKRTKTAFHIFIIHSAVQQRDEGKVMSEIAEANSVIAGQNCKWEPIQKRK